MEHVIDINGVVYVSFYYLSLRIYQLTMSSAILKQVRNNICCEEVWEPMRGDNFCYNVVQSMCRRVSDVILADGGYYSYKILVK